MERDHTALLELRPGARALDVGCGIGDRARALVDFVSPAGEVVGLDASAAIVKRARKRHNGAVRFVVGDAHHMPFDTATFDAVRVERTLQHLARVDRALNELHRVTRPGGIVLATEPDWGSLAVAGRPRDLIRSLVAAAEHQIRNPWIGRELADLMAEAGLEQIEVSADAIMMRDFDQLHALTDVGTIAADLRELASDDADELLQALSEAGQDGRAVVALTVFTAVGRPPG
jgi:ubiquinone/menaquinone biosynthesis C-methylase UbiE